jgi:hypothetical protein
MVKPKTSKYKISFTDIVVVLHANSNQQLKPHFFYRNVGLPDKILSEISHLKEVGVVIVRFKVVKEVLIH